MKKTFKLLILVLVLLLSFSFIFSSLLEIDGSLPTVQPTENIPNNIINIEKVMKHKLI